MAFPDNQAQILPYNRTVKDLAGQTPEQFLDRLAAQLPVREGQATPPGKGEVSVFLAGRWYSLDFSGTGSGGCIERQFAWTLRCCSITSWSRS